MANDDTKKLMQQVEDLTGYRVSVDRAKVSGANAKMHSASDKQPVHVIYVADDKVAYADYIVATQCVMLMTMWSHPEGVIEFMVINEKLDYAIRKQANWSGFSKLDREGVENVAETLVKGLVQQLSSTPREMLAVEYCYRNCPSLRSEQADMLASDFRGYTSSIQPDRRRRLPPDIFEKNQTMCAALGLLWSELSGDRSILLPYESIGLTGSGEDLLKLYREAQGSDGERIVETVDAWAEALNMRSLYKWGFRKR